MTTAASAPPTVSVSTTVRAPAELVWDLVSDVARMGEWSPETTGCRWLDTPGGPKVGARFVGRNQNDAKSWQTVCTVTEAERGRTFAFEVTGAKVFPVAEWRYELTPTADGCAVTESWVDRRNALLRRITPYLTGVAERPEWNRSTMTETLTRLKAAAESLA